MTHSRDPLLWVALVVVVLTAGVLVNRCLLPAITPAPPTPPPLMVVTMLPLPLVPPPFQPTATATPEERIVLTPTSTTLPTATATPTSAPTIEPTATAVRTMTQRGP